MEKASKGRAVLGFFITVIMIVLLMVDGMLIGLKTTVLRGSDVVEILSNANAFEMMSELLTTELDSVMGDTPMMEEAVATIFSEEILESVAADMTKAIVNGDEVDLAGITDDCVNVIQSTSDEMINQVFDEVAGDGEISITDLTQNEILKTYEQQVGMNISPLVEDYVGSIYGDTTIKVDAEKLEAIKNETKAAVQADIIPKLEEAMDIYIDDINAAVNQELQAINETYDIAGMIRTVEKILEIVRLTIIAVSAVLAILVVAELFLVYRKALNRGLRNIGVAAIFAGLVIALIGAMTSIAKNLVLGVFGMSEMNQDKLMQIVMNFFDMNLHTVGSGFLVIAAVYLVVAIVCIGVASAIRKTQENYY